MKKRVVALTLAGGILFGSGASAAVTYYFGTLKDDLKVEYTNKVGQAIKAIRTERQKVVLTERISEEQRIKKETEAHLREKLDAIKAQDVKEEIQAEADAIIQEVNKHIDQELEKRGY